MIIKNVMCTNMPQVITIGRQLENNYRQFVFDCSGFGNDIASVTLVHQRKNDVAPYLVTTSNTNTLTWNVSDTDTAYSGYGKAELRVVFADGLAKSAIYTTFVLESITADATIPEPLQSWYDAMIEYIDDHSVSPEEIEQAVADYLEEHPITAPVTSVNSKIGDVVLDASDVGALPDSTVIPTKTSQLQNDSGYITSAPVTSVNGQTGAVTIAVPTKTSQLQNDSGYITSVPVTSVNSKTGAVSLSASDVGALPSTTTYVSSFNGSTGAVTYTAPVTSVNGQTGAVTVTDTDTTYSISISGNVITLTPSTGTAQTINLPADAVSSVDGKTGSVTVLPSGGSSGQVLSKASGTDYDVEWSTPSGGGSDWSVLYNATTTEEALLQIPVTNIDCTEVEVQIVMPTWQSNVNIYVPLMQTNGTHWNVNGYLRMLKEIPSNTSQKRYCGMHFGGVTITGHAYFDSWCALNTGTSNLQYKYDESANMTAGMHITALSVATIANVPAGTMVLVRGR